jgi:ubiquitin-conjugating enzyme E2 D
VTHFERVLFFLLQNKTGCEVSSLLWFYLLVDFMAGNNMALKCIRKQVLAVEQGNPTTNFSMTLMNDDDPYHYQATMFGPTDSPFEGGIYRLDMQFNDQYPLKPPKVTFITKIFHPNIGVDGKICIDILYNQWCPALSIESVLLSIQSIFTSPHVNNSLPVNNEAANLYTQGRAKYDPYVRLYTKKYAV